MPSAPSILYTEEAHEIICDAYTYGYPLVLMDVTRQRMTNAPRRSTRPTPINQFAHSQTFADNSPDADAGADADALQSVAWLNLTKEPVVLSLPEVRARYYEMELTDAWMTAFAALGSRTTGHGAGHYAIVGPRWSGRLPSGVRSIDSPTAMVRVMGRTQATTERDCTEVHAIQQRYALRPLSAWNKGSVLAPKATDGRELDSRSTPTARVARMDASTFFGRLNTLMSDNPPHPVDALAVQRFASVGVGPGRPFELRHDPLVARSINGSVRTALARIVVEATKPVTHVRNGWQVQPSNVGPSVTDYMWRAVVAMLRPGACLAEDTVCLHAAVDQHGARLSGAERYTLRFPRGHMPPVSAFWSVAMYTARHTFVPDTIRPAINSVDPLVVDADGSIVLYLQHEPPATVANWLPAPRDQFTLTMRLHWPNREVLDGSWAPPPIERIA